MLNIFKKTLRKLNEMNYIVILDGNNYVIKKRDSDEVFAEIDCKVKRKDNWLEKCYEELKLVG